MRRSLIADEARALIREFKDIIVGFDIVPDVGRRGRFLLVAATADNQVINLGGGMVQSRARDSKERASDLLLDLRTDVHEQRQEDESGPFANSSRRIEIKVHNGREITTSELTTARRMLISQLADMPLQTIADQRAIPKDFWQRNGGRRQVPRRVFWQPHEQNERGRQVRPSVEHLTLDVKQTLCGQEIPDSSAHYVTWDWAKQRPCKACEKQAEEWGYEFDV